MTEKDDLIERLTGDIMDAVTDNVTFDADGQKIIEAEVRVLLLRELTRLREERDGLLRHEETLKDALYKLGQALKVEQAVGHRKGFEECREMAAKACETVAIRYRGTGPTELLPSASGEPVGHLFAKAIRSLNAVDHSSTQNSFGERLSDDARRDIRAIEDNAKKTLR